MIGNPRRRVLPCVAAISIAACIIPNMPRIKIIATIGPASDTPEKIESLIKAGMNVARLNFSHGTHDYHAQLITNIRSAAARLKKPIAILQDLQGPQDSRRRISKWRRHL